MIRKVTYLPGLNGIRAFASIAVVVSHITLGLKEFGLNSYIIGIYEILHQLSMNEWIDDEKFKTYIKPPYI